MANLKCLLFDLDGTLTDPKPGITRSIQHALSNLGQPVPEEEDLLWCIGPPLRDNFATLLNTADEGLLARAVALYRERFGTIGLYENEVYPGIPEMLTALTQQGYPLFVATSKPHDYARQILDHFGLLDFFDAVYGSEMDGRRVDKGELLRHALEQEAIAPGMALMLGDRRHDVLGAKQNGMVAGGILYGYGTLDELEVAGADYLFRCPEEIVAFAAEGMTMRG